VGTCTLCSGPLEIEPTNHSSPERRATRTSDAVKLHLPVTVLGRYHRPDPTSKCPPHPRDECKPYTWLVVWLPNENVVLLPPRWIDYQRQTVRFDSETPKPLTPGQVG
jgi:hypothetical protein